jgi:hypothetical protein
MKIPPIVYIIISALLMLLSVACSQKKDSGNSKTNPKLIGTWTAKSDGSKLIVTDKTFAMDSPDPEDYFIKGDTIFTSFEGNLPYTKYGIQKLDDHTLQLFTPDSTSVVFTK